MNYTKFFDVDSNDLCGLSLSQFLPYAFIKFDNLVSLEEYCQHQRMLILDMF